MQINLSKILSSLPSLNKDVQRISLFTAAVAKRVLELTITDPMIVPDFVRDASILMAKWTERTRRLSFADLFRDPYRDLREETRRFAAAWNLDPEFRNLMG